MVHLKITPDSRLDNQNVEQLAQTLCLYQSPLERWNGRGLNRHPFVSFETVLKKNETSFIITVQEEMETLARKAIETTWPKVGVEKIDDPLNQEPHLISTLDLNYHYMFAIRVDRREISHLASILETLSLMNEDDLIYIQSLAIPANKDWYQGAVNAYERFKKGDMPQKLQFNKQGIAKTGLKVTASMILGTIDIVTELMTGEEPEKINLSEGERALILRDGHLRTETLQKVRGDAFDTSIRIGIVCKEEKRRKALMRMVSMAFRELDGDNHWVTHEANAEKTWQRMLDRIMGFKVHNDYLSIPEVSRLFLLPTGQIQEKYHIPNIKQLEKEVSNEIMEGGLYLGDHMLKGEEKPVYQPTSNDDLLCLPHVVIGPMGSGKTLGYAANLLVESVKKGYGALAIDPAKGEIGDCVTAALPKDKVNRLNLAKMVISLDFCEANHSSKAKTRLANTIVSFFGVNDETLGQTTRYLKAAVMAAKTHRLSEYVRILGDDEYRTKILETMPDGFNKTTLLSMDPEVMSDKRKAQILAPIYNRLEVILSDEHLSECFESKQSLDMVELMSQRKATIIDVGRKDGLDPMQIDVIVNLLTLKIDLAMGLRKEENQFPYFCVYDEPHQFLKSARIWKALAVESRKWRVGFVWMFHSWEQIPRDLGEIIKSAGPHYHIYAGASKKTWKDLTEEITPYTLEDGLKLPRFHAINVIRTQEGMVPFIAHMAKPPVKHNFPPVQ